ncbi:MAG: ATP-binding protein [Candidatus Obscuribacterales bacterium]|nr:ATP-binding protein [Candidatus Obscuribacterales bacterium]
MVPKAKSLLTIKLENEYDFILARRRARQIAYLLNFSESDQIRIAAATSEIARNALQHANRGTVYFQVEDQQYPITLSISIVDQGTGFADIESALCPSAGMAGLSGVKRLLDDLVIESTPTGSTVTMVKKLPNRKLPFSNEDLNKLTQALADLTPENPLDEVYAQNQELVRTFDALKTEQARLGESERRYRSLSESLEQVVSERTEQLTAALRHAREAIAIKSQFVANMSHEIRTPLTSVVGMAEILTHDTQLSEQSRELTWMLFDSSKRLLTILNDLLDFSKLEAKMTKVENRKFNIIELVDSVISVGTLQSRENNLVLRSTASDSVPVSISGDESRVRQVLINLIQNALKFTKVGGVEVLLEREGELVRVSVADTGIGIKNTSLSKIFEPFEQADSQTHREFGGSGLGLSISKELVELMGGEIGVFSEEGKGSVFWFTLPLRGRD